MSEKFFINFNSILTIFPCYIYYITGCSVVPRIGSIQLILFYIAAVCLPMYMTSVSSFF